MGKVIVIGSGPSGVNVSVPLTEAGHRVLMLDFGKEDHQYRETVPRDNFLNIRAKCRNQHKFFLGTRFEGIPLGDVRVGAQLTPPRAHVLADTEKWLPIRSSSFSASPSLALGGLGAAWSAGVFPFNDHELRQMSLSLDELRPHYDTVIERIGVSGQVDDLSPMMASISGLLSPLELDPNARSILANYTSHRGDLNSRGFFLGQTPLAVVTRRHRNRGPHEYMEMDYWGDLDRSVYRPQWTLEELRVLPNFSYSGNVFVESFKEVDGKVVVTTTDVSTNESVTHSGHALVIAAGTLGTTRIVLRSLERYGEAVPILCNPYTYTPTLNLSMVGRSVPGPRHSLAQLTAVALPSAPGTVSVQAQVFSYRSLLTFKLLKEMPLGYRESLRIMRALLPAIAILGIHHEDHPGPSKTCTLVRDSAARGRDSLRIDYRLTDVELKKQRRSERALLRIFLRLGCLPLKSIRPGNGANLHYAGSLPMGSEKRELTCDLDGRLNGTNCVFIADGSIIPWLPAKGLTFNIMANADRIGVRLARSLD